MRIQRLAGNAATSRLVEAHLQRKEEPTADGATRAGWTVTIADVGTFQATSLSMAQRAKRQDGGQIVVAKTSDELSAPLFRIYTEGKPIARLLLDSATLAIEAKNVVITDVQVSGSDKPVESYGLDAAEVRFAQKTT